MIKKEEVRRGGAGQEIFETERAMYEQEMRDDLFIARSIGATKNADDILAALKRSR